MEEAQRMPQALGVAQVASVTFPPLKKTKNTSQILNTLVATIALPASGIKWELGDLRLQMEWNWILLPKTHKLSS